MKEGKFGYRIPRWTFCPQADGRVDLPQKRRQIFIHDDMNRFF
jgi:hypothetical protein